MYRSQLKTFVLIFKMPITQLPPLRPTGSPPPRQSSRDPRVFPATTLVMEEYRPPRDNKKYFFMCLKHLKDIWLRLYALEKKQRRDEHKYSVAIDELKEQTRQLTEEIGWFADNANENVRLNGLCYSTC